MRLIRLALLSGVLLFGGVAWYVSGNDPMPGIPADDAQLLTWGFTGLSAASLAALVVIRSLQARAAAMEQRATLAVVGWAMGEAPALLGGVIYLLTGNPLAYLAGVSVLLIAFVLVPVPED